MIALLLAAFVCPPTQRVAEWKPPASAGCTQQGTDTFDANLTGEHDKLVQARFRCGKGRALRIAVLVPLPDGASCKLDGEDLSIDLKPGSKRILDFVSLTRPDRNVVQVKDSSEGDATLAFYEAQGWSLKKIFFSQTLETLATAHGPLPQKWTLQLGPEFPKSIRTQRCVEGAPCDDPEDFVYAKAGGKYVKK